MKRCEVNRRIRKIVGITQQELADKIMVSKQTISNYETGRTNTRFAIEHCVELVLDQAARNNKDEAIRIVCIALASYRDRG